MTPWAFPFFGHPCYRYRLQWTTTPGGTYWRFLWRNLSLTSGFGARFSSLGASGPRHLGCSRCSLFLFFLLPMKRTHVNRLKTFGCMRYYWLPLARAKGGASSCGVSEKKLQRQSHCFPAKATSKVAGVGLSTSSLQQPITSLCLSSGLCILAGHGGGTQKRVHRVALRHDICWADGSPERQAGFLYTPLPII